MTEVKKVLESKSWKIIIFIILDFFAITLCSIFAINLRFDFGQIPQEFLNNFGICILIDTIIMYGVFSILKLYTSVWSYASIIELLNIIIGCFLYETVSFGYHDILNIKIPRSFFVIRLLLMILTISAIRYSYRIIRVIILTIKNKNRKLNTMIIGGGAAGRLLIDEILGNQREYNSNIRCIIDDNYNLKGSYIEKATVLKFFFLLPICLLI